MTTHKVLTAEELAALVAYAAEHGRTWKVALQTDWYYARRPGILQCLRNDPGFGPRGLIHFRLPKKIIVAPEKNRFQSSGESGILVNHQDVVGNDADAAQHKGHTMTTTLTYRNTDKGGRNAIYTGAAIAINIGLSAFPNKVPPPTLELNGDLAPKREKKQPMTADERKAARAAQPKLTLAQRIEKADKRYKELLALRDRQAAATPTPEPVSA